VKSKSGDGVFFTGKKDRKGSLGEEKTRGRTASGSWGVLFKLKKKRGKPRG